MSATPLPERFEAHLAQSRLLAGPATAVLAVSGGADSLALLDLVAGLRESLRLDLVVAHADHGILPASAEVAAHLRSLATERYGLDVEVGSLGLGADASETRARIARYAFLREVQAARGAHYLVTAHHADDQVETVLLRLLRGSAPAGLAAMAARGPRGLVRPLLPFRRAELRAHAGAVGLGAFDDPSNADLRHTRAWVRHRLLPLIAERLGHEAVRALLDVAGHAREEVLAWDRLLEVLPGLDLQVEEGRFAVARGVLSGYHNALAARVLRAAARRAGLRVGPRAATRLARFAAGAASGRRAQLGEGVAAEAAFDRLVVAVECAAAPAPVELRGESGEAEFGAYVLCWRREVMPGPPRRREWTTWIAGPDALAVRAPAAGDRLRPLGGAGHRAVRRLLMEARIPRGERARYPVVVRGTEVVWVPGVCRAEVAVPEPGTVAVRIDARTR